MFDCSSHLKKFYDDHVRLGAEDKQKLAGMRDANLMRLTSGLEKLGDKDHTTYANFKNSINQGSYAMHTLNQHPDNDYDIDVGVVFGADDIPSSPLEARKRVAAAMKLSGEVFKEEPEARTNAVTMWYADGCHVDFAVYREVADSEGTSYEHASTEWRKRDPLATNKWFQGKVDGLSPKKEQGAKVDEQQMRRVVRLIKFFAKSRPSWNLPGGMIISTLVAECYVPDQSRDDVALVLTLKTIKRRLSTNLSIASPIESGAVLTEKEKFRVQVAEFLVRLEERLSDLDALDDSSCDEIEAVGAWSKFFNHSYWDGLESGTKVGDSSTTITAVKNAAPIASLFSRYFNGYRSSREEFIEDRISGIAADAFVIGVEVEARFKGKSFPYGRIVLPLSKGVSLRFHAVLPRYANTAGRTLYWKVKNGGGEASAIGGLRGEITKDCGSLYRDESTLYTGSHYVECYLIDDANNIMVGKGRFEVPIA